MSEINIQSLSQRIRRRLEEDEDKDKTRTTVQSGVSTDKNSLEKSVQQVTSKIQPTTVPQVKPTQPVARTKPIATTETEPAGELNYTPYVPPEEKPDPTFAGEIVLREAGRGASAVYNKTKEGLNMVWGTPDFIAQTSSDLLMKIPAYNRFMTQAAAGIDAGSGRAAKAILNTSDQTFETVYDLFTFNAGGLTKDARKVGDVIETTYNTKTGSSIAVDLLEKTSNIGLKLASKGAVIRGDTKEKDGLLEFTLDIAVGVGFNQMARFRKEYNKLYQEALKSWEAERYDETNSYFEEVMYAIQDSVPQAGIGILIGIGSAAATTKATKNPKLGAKVGWASALPYWATISAGGQIKEEGEVTSGTNIMIDALGDSIINASLGGLLKLPASGFKRFIVNTQIEGFTEVAQTFLKFIDRYQEAETQEEKNAIFADAKLYVTSGDIGIEYIVGVVAGGAGDIAVNSMGGGSAGNLTNVNNVAGSRAMRSKDEGVNTPTPPTTDAVDLIARAQRGDTLTDIEQLDLQQARGAFIDYADTFSNVEIVLPSNENPQGAPILGVSTVPVGDRVAVKYFAGTEENGLAIDYDLNALYNSPKEATVAALDSMEEWAESRLSNPYSQITPVEQKRLEEIVEKTRQAKNPTPPKKGSEPRAPSFPPPAPVATGKGSDLIGATVRYDNNDYEVVGGANDANIIKIRRPGEPGRFVDASGVEVIDQSTEGTTKKTEPKADENETKTKKKSGKESEKKQEDIKITELTEDGQKQSELVVAFETGRNGKTKVVVYNQDKSKIAGEIIDLEKAEEKYGTKDRTELANRIVNGRFDSGTDTWNVIEPKAKTEDKKTDSQPAKKKAAKKDSDTVTTDTVNKTALEQERADVQAELDKARKAKKADEMPEAFDAFTSAITRAKKFNEKNPRSTMGNFNLEEIRAEQKAVEDIIEERNAAATNETTATNEKGNIETKLVKNPEDGDKITINGTEYTYEKDVDVTGDVKEILRPPAMKDDSLYIVRDGDYVGIETMYIGVEPVQVLRGTPPATTAKKTAEKLDKQNKPLEAEQVRQAADTLTIVPDNLEADIELILTEDGIVDTLRRRIENTAAAKSFLDQHGGIKDITILEKGGFTGTFNDGKTFNTNDIAKAIGGTNEQQKKTEQQLTDDFRQAKKKAKEKKRLFGGKQVVDRPNTLVGKTPLKDFLMGRDRVIFTVLQEVEEGRLYLYEKTETGETRLYPSALGLVEDNLRIGQEVILDASELKAPGTYYRLVDEDGNVVGESLPETTDEMMERTWHGSPFQWERPDLNKVGSGEGAAAYGWGFYVTEVEGIGRDYRDKLTPKASPIDVLNETYIDGTSVAAGIAKSIPKEEQTIKGLIADNGRDKLRELANSQPDAPAWAYISDAINLTVTALERANSWIDGQITILEKNYGDVNSRKAIDAIIKDYRDLLAKLDLSYQDTIFFDGADFTSVDTIKAFIGRNTPSIPASRDQFNYNQELMAAMRDYNQGLDKKKIDTRFKREGYLYELDVDDAAIDTMLLWDEPYANQPKNVKTIIDKLFAKLDFNAYESKLTWDEVKKDKLFTGESMYRRLVSEVQTNQTFFFDQGLKQESAIIGDNLKTVSLALNTNGVRGVKYRTGMTRARGNDVTPTFNYVVFDVSDITVVTRNGQRLQIEEKTEGEVSTDGEGNVLSEVVHNPKDAKLFNQAKKHATFQSFLKAQGKRYYHGTLANFQVFNPNKRGSNTQWDNASWGYFFIGDKNRAKKFANDTRMSGDRRPANVIPAYLDLKNPLDLTLQGIFSKKKQAKDLYEVLIGGETTGAEALQWLDENLDLGDIAEFYSTLYSDQEYLTQLKARGYDGVISSFGKDNGREIKEYVVFEPDQIRTEAQLQDIYRQANPPTEPEELAESFDQITDYEKAEGIRKYIVQGNDPSVAQKTFSNRRFMRWVERTRLGRSEMPVKPGQYITLWRQKEMVKGRVQSYSLRKQWDDQKPYRVHYDDILFFLDSQATFDLFNKAYKGNERDIYTESLAKWVEFEGSEVWVRTNNTKSSEQPRTEDGRYASNDQIDELREQSQKDVADEYYEVSKRVQKAESNPQKPSRFLPRIPSRPSKLGDLRKNDKKIATNDDVEYAKLVRRQEIARVLANDLGAVVRYGKFRAKASGIYKIKQGVIRMSNKYFRNDRKGGSLTTFIHEIGHYLDYTTHPFRQQIPKAELKPLLEEYGGGYDNIASKERRPEAFAEFLRYYITEPEKAKTKAPQFYKYFEDTLRTGYPEILQPILTARNDFDAWLNQPALAKTMAQIDYDGENRKGKVREFFSSLDAMFRFIVDDLAEVRKFDQKTYQHMRLSRGWTGIANVWLEGYTTSAARFKKGDNGQWYIDKKGKSLRDILQKVEDKGALRELSAYLAARRDLELTDRGITTGFDNESSVESIEYLEKKHPEFAKVADELDTYQTHLLEYVRDSGLITNDAFKAMKQLNKSYVPFYRVHQELQGQGFMGSGFQQTTTPIKRIKGSDMPIVDPIESIIGNTYSLIYASEQNQAKLVARAAANSGDLKKAQMLEKVPVDQTLAAKVDAKDIVKQALNLDEFTMMMLDPKQQELIGDLEGQIVNIFRPAFQQKGNVVTIMVDGKPEYYVAEEGLYQAMANLHRDEIALVWQIVAQPARWLRGGAVLAPDFMVRNIPRDTGSAAIISRNNFIPYLDSARGAASVLGKDDYYHAWLLAGGDMATLVSRDRSDVRMTRDLLLNRSAQMTSYATSPLKGFQQLSNFTEQITRVGEMKKALKRGKDPFEAAFDSRNVSSDFGRHGSETASLSAMNAFFNARVQGLVITYESIKQRPVETMFKGAMYYTLPTLLLYLVNRDDEEYWEIPRWQRDLFWLVKVNGVWYRIPKPFEVGLIFATIPERMFEYIDKRDSKTFDGMFDLLVTKQIPNPFAISAFTPFIENITNYSFFLERPIVPQGVQNLPNEFQYTSQTSEVAKIMGGITGMSPMKIDNVLDGYFATLGRYVRDGMDSILKGTGVVHSVPEPTKTGADIPILKAFVVRDPSGSGSESVNQFYKERDKATKAYNAFKKLTEEGKYEEALTYQAKHPEIKLYKLYNAVARDISEMRKARDAVYQSETMSPQEKRATIDQINELMTTAAYRSINVELK